MKRPKLSGERIQPLRKLKGSWINEYIKYYAPASEAPYQYLYWSAASIIGASLKRNVWVDRGTFKCYPNHYVVLVGHPGIGKGSAINPAIGLLKEAGTANIVSDRVTIEYILEKLAKGFPAQTLLPGGGVAFTNDATCLISAPEMQVFATASQATLSILTDLWDNKTTPWDYGTKTQGKYLINNPTINLLGGTTPEWLVSAIPQSAVSGGFTRRVNFVYAKNRAQRIAWPQVQNHSSIYQEMIDDLRTMATLQGEVKFDKQARKIFEDFYHSRECETSEWDDEATASYKTTKAIHAIKLATVLTIAERDSLVITETNIVDAIRAVSEVESTISLVFRAVGESDLAVACDRVLRFLEIKGLAQRSDILRANWRHISHNDLDIILATMMQAGMIVEHNQGNKVLYAAAVQPGAAAASATGGLP